VRDYFEIPQYFEQENTVILDRTLDYSVSFIYDNTDADQINAVEYARNSVRFIRVEFQRSNGNISQETFIVYDKNGTTVLRTRTYTYSYSNDNISSVTRVET
jgi:hypothetical protein